MNDKLFIIGSCIIVLGILLYGVCWIITCQQGEYLLSIYYQVSISIVIVGGLIVIVGGLLKFGKEMGWC